MATIADIAYNMFIIMAFTYTDVLLLCDTFVDNIVNTTAIDGNTIDFTSSGVLLDRKSEYHIFTCMISKKARQSDQYRYHL